MDACDKRLHINIAAPRCQGGQQNKHQGNHDLLTALASDTFLPLQKLEIQKL
jgi:hypothetical protein